MTFPYVYIASSWRNELYADVLAHLRGQGFDCYDFRDSSGAFGWSEIDPDWLKWTAAEYIEALEHPIAKREFARDMGALMRCDALVLVLPCGRSAHLEAGWAAGAGKHTIILTRDGEEPELMAGMCDLVTESMGEVIGSLRATKPRGVSRADTTEALRTRHALHAITEERTKQIRVWGWDAAHDDRYTEGELADAASLMAAPSKLTYKSAPPFWPGDNSDWAKHLARPRMRQLAVAGSLIVAEMERLMRAKGGV